jgi:DNA-nicking Smr family endonuclease
MRRPRHLSPEERALWEHVTRQAEPLHRRRDPVPEPAAPLPAPPPPPAPVPRFRVGERVDHRRDHDLLPSLAEDMGRAPVRMDAKTHGRMKKGRLIPESRIDLHGMTVAEAHPALLAFILTAHAQGKRLVLVITGKGRVRDDLAPMPVRQGVLRHQVPQWLGLPPLSALILQIAPAHVTHGGGGAYYVYLRRPR